MCARRPPKPALSVPCQSHPRLAGLARKCWMTNGQRHYYNAEQQLNIIMDKPVATVRDAWLSALATLQATATAKKRAHDLSPHQQRHIIRGAVHTLLEATPDEVESDDDSDDL